MKQRFGRITALVLCVILLISCTIPAGAVPALPLKVGDVDRDNAVTVVDVVLIQRYLAKMQEPSELEEALSDADGDGEVSVLDVTAVQRHLANMSGSFTGAEITDWYIGTTSFHTDCEVAIADHYSTTEVCYVGIPVHFTAKVFWGAEPRRFTLYVDGETVQEVEAKGFEKAVLTHTFTEPGEHVLSCEVECRYGLTKRSSQRVRVENLPEDGSPAVMGAVFYDESSTGSGNSVLTVIAAGGTAPYQYNYRLYYDGLSPLCLSPEDGSEIIVEPEDKGYTTGYLDTNEINLNELFSKYVKKPSEPGKSDVMRAEITVRDANGKESQPVTASYIGYEICY